MRLQALSKKLFLAGIVLAAIMLPLEIIPNFLISIGSLLTTLLLAQYGVVQLISSRQLRPTKTQLVITLCLALPVISALLSSLVALEPSIALRTSITLGHLAFRAWLIWMLADETELHWFQNAVLWVGAATVAFGYFQYFGDLAALPQTITQLIPQYSSHGTYAFPRVHSLSHEPLYFANFLLLPIGLLIARFFQQAGRPPRSQSYLLVATLALFWSSVARGAIAGLVVALLVLALACWRSQRALLRLGGQLALSIVLAVALVDVAGLASGRYALSVFTHHAAETNDASFTNRTGLWPQAAEALKQHPLLGVGPGNSREFIDANTSRTGAPHNQLPVFNNSYLTLVSEQGLLGVLLYLPLVALLLFGVIIALRSSLHAATAGFVIALIGTAIQANTFEAFSLLRLWIIIGFALVAAKPHLITARRLRFTPAVPLSGGGSPLRGSHS